MKKLYSLLAAGIVTFGAFAATPVSEIIGFEQKTATQGIEMQKTLPLPESKLNTLLASPARIPASESRFYIDPNAFYSCNFSIFSAQTGKWSDTFTANTIELGDDGLTYSFDFFQLFSDVTLDPMVMEFDPETGLFTYKTDKPVTSFVDSSGETVEVYYKAGMVSDDGNAVVDPDSDIEFMLGENSILMQSPLLFIARPGKDENGEDTWFFMAAFTGCEIGFCNAVMTDKYTYPTSNGGKATIARSYGIYTYPTGDSQLAMLNAMMCGHYNYEIVGDYDADSKTITYTNQVLESIRVGSADAEPQPLYATDEYEGPVVFSIEKETSDGTAYTVLSAPVIYEMLEDGRSPGMAENVEIRLLYDFDAAMAGVDAVATDDNSNAPVEYFNLQGVRVANPESGIYLRRQGSDVKKVIIR